MVSVTIGVWSQNIKTEGIEIVDESGGQVVLRGMGLGGWMLMEGYMMQSSDVADTQHEFRARLEELMGEEKTDEFFNTWLDNHVTRKDIDSLASWGFNSVRLPMHYNLFTFPIEDEPVAGQNTWLSKGFEMVDSLLQWCAINNIYLILDLHAAPGGQGANAAISDYDPSKPSLWESEANRDKTVALWAKLAERYAGEPWIGGYDLLNEVNWYLPGNVMLRALYEEITEAIREVDTTHILFIEGNGFANDFTGLTPPWDDNMAYSFHKYWNYNDPGSIQWVLDIRDDHNVPLWMGEAGENSNVWFTDAISLFENNGIGWSWWPMKRIETIVSPFSIYFSEGYKNVLKYWRNEGPEPTEDEAYEWMMELAVNANSANCQYQKDVHDAQLRQVNNATTIPFATHEIPGVLHMSDYDLGQLHEAYYDVDHANYAQSTGEFQAWNSGWRYRNDGVDIEDSQDQVNSNGYHVGFVNKGEWMNYTVQVESTASYTARVRVASQVSGGHFHLAVNGEDITPTQVVDATGSWQAFTFLDVQDVILEEGEQVVTFHVDNATSFNISSIEFVEAGSIDPLPFLAINGQTRQDEKSIEVAVNLPVSPGSLEGSEGLFAVTVNGEEESITSVSLEEDRPRTLVLSMGNPKVYTDDIKVSYAGTAITSLSGKTLMPFENLAIRNTLRYRNILPCHIQAEDYVLLEGMGTEPTEDLGGGLNLGWTDPGDYADYLIYASDVGFYKINLRVAAQSAQGKAGFYLIDENNNETELATVNTPVTGGWQTWTTVSTNAAVPAGIYTLRMKVLTGGFNLNWFSFELLDGTNNQSLGNSTLPLVFPNPVNQDFIHIDLRTFDQGAITLHLFNLQGNKVRSKICQNEGKPVTVDVSALPKGVYVLQVTTREGTYSQSIIKQ
jgi:hypothetical protein